MEEEKGKVYGERTVIDCYYCTVRQRIMCNMLCSCGRTGKAPLNSLKKKTAERCAMCNRNRWRSHEIRDKSRKRSNESRDNS